MKNHDNKPQKNSSYTKRLNEITPERSAQLVALFKSGLGIYKIARDLGMNDHVVREHLKTKGLKTVKVDNKSKKAVKASE